MLANVVSVPWECSLKVPSLGYLADVPISRISISHIRWPMNLHRGLDYAILEEIRREERGERREERSLKYSLIPQSLHDNMLKRSTSEDGYTIDVNTGRRNDKQGEDETKRETMRLRGDPLTLTHRQLAQIIWLMSLGWFK